MTVTRRERWHRTPKYTSFAQKETLLEAVRQGSLSEDSGTPVALYRM